MSLQLDFRRLKHKLFSLIVLIGVLTFVTSCTDLFTTSAFSSFKTDYSDMSKSQLQENLAQSGLPSDPEELQDVEDLLVDFRIDLDAGEDDPDVIAQYVEETKQLIDVNFQQADVEGLMADILTTSDEDGANLLSSLEGDTERLDNLEEASGYAVEAFEADPDSLSTTQLVVGGVGLISDILQDDTLSQALEDSPTTSTADLTTAGFNAQQISDIQTASAMLDVAEAGAEGDMASLFEGLPF